MVQTVLVSECGDWVCSSNCLLIPSEGAFAGNLAFIYYLFMSLFILELREHSVGAGNKGLPCSTHGPNANRAIILFGEMFSNPHIWLHM